MLLGMLSGNYSQLMPSLAALCLPQGIPPPSPLLPPLTPSLGQFSRASMLTGSRLRLIEGEVVISFDPGFPHDQ